MIDARIDEYAEAKIVMWAWEQTGTRIPQEVKARLCKATQAVLELQDLLIEDLPTNAIGRI